ncbi:multiple myeloma tumor-associated protein 2 homolog isoform X2 [Montipora capricornis]|uniref:multiple myeloma tumor-associated protein 2 homolog isoform X2 n=1 Tax=Montipora capricornis TaxID=246305 RepID=UPI0035F151E4
MYHPSRGGVRGGQDQFDWEDVKADKHRENYLGHSVKAPVGRWQKGKDLHWYTKSGKGDSAMTKQQEKDAIKRMEAEALALALGKGNAKKQPGGVTKQELAEVCRKGQMERDSMDIERVEGMGFSSSRARLMDVSSVPVKETLGATGVQEVSQTPDVYGRTSETTDNICPGQAQTATVSYSKKAKKKKGKREKKSKKEKKHKRKHVDEDTSVKEDKQRRKRHYSESEKRTIKNNHSSHQKDSKRRKSDAESDSDLSDGKDRNSRHSKHPSSSDEESFRRTREKRRSITDDKPKQRRQRHDTE